MLNSSLNIIISVDHKTISGGPADFVRKFIKYCKIEGYSYSFSDDCHKPWQKYDKNIILSIGPPSTQAFSGGQPSNKDLLFRLLDQGIPLVLRLGGAHFWK